MKLTRREIVNAAAGLAGLSDKSANYVFDHKVRYRIQKNFRILKSKSDDIESTKNDLIKELSKGTYEIKPGTPEMGAFQAKWNEFLKDVEDVEGLLLFSLYADLKFESNNIPAPLLCDLGQLIIDEAPAS